MMCSDCIYIGGQEYKKVAICFWVLSQEKIGNDNKSVNAQVRGNGFWFLSWSNYVACHLNIRRTLMQKVLGDDLIDNIYWGH